MTRDYPPDLPPNGAPWPDEHEPTPFQRAVVETVAALRPGDLASYADIAEEAGHPGAGQAVANVLRRAAGLPWWRVVPADGRVYRSHRPVQIPLLRAEGHPVDDDGRIR
jgi:methylated-DNA-protein-cysteine methyltransferase-like protein